MATSKPNIQDLHACMGLNSCKNQGAYYENDCAGKGYCSTTAAHSCHVQNDCRNQGGCGLYGTAEEQDQPGSNCCKGMGSCATPMAAERFSTDGPNQGKSVWKRARAVFFEDGRWNEVLDFVKQNNPDAYNELSSLTPGQRKTLKPDAKDGQSFEAGPPTAWVDQKVSDYAACGSSGMSGNSCS